MWYLRFYSRLGYNTAEQANLLAIQAEERSKHKLKFLEKLYCDSKKKNFQMKLLKSAIKDVPVKLELKHDEDITP